MSNFEFLTQEKLGKGFNYWHLQLFALAGAIGVGLFWSTAFSIQYAGPAIILCYIIGAVLIFIVTRALGEMVVDLPISGSFSAYAYIYLGPKGGYITGWMYWLMWIVTGMAEITACGLFGSYLFPSIHEWIFALFSLIFVTLINLRPVKLFACIEFVLACVKLAVIGALFVIGISVLGFDYQIDDYKKIEPAINNLYALDGGFMPNGWKGVSLAMAIVVFSLLGAETIGLTAGETSEPLKAIPPAVKKAPLRVIICYIGSLFVILCLIPWNNVSVETSPFVIIFNEFSIPKATELIYCVVLLAAFSVLNEAVYSSARMSYTLALQGRGPVLLGVTNSRTKIPAKAVLFSCLVMGGSVILSYFYPSSVIFEIIVNVAGFAALWIWATIIVIHHKFKKQKEVYKEKTLFPMPLYPILNWVGLTLIIIIFCALLFSGHPGTYWPMLLGIIFIFFFALVYAIMGWHKDDLGKV